jgi:nitrilase
MSDNRTMSEADLKPWRVAAIQMVSTPDVSTNLETTAELIAEAVRQGAAMAVLPEYFCLMGYRDSDKVAIQEEPGHGPLQRFLADQASQHGIWLVGGTIPLVSPHADRVFNATLVFNPLGKQVVRYDKIHLFGFQRGSESYDESRTIYPGGQPVAFDSPCGRVGLSICYDLRFPELFRRLSPMSLLLVPAAFTYTTGSAHWEVLLRARAIENQCYVLAAAQGGQHLNGRRTWGHSMFIDPWGQVVTQWPEGPGVVVGDIDPLHLQSVRESLPALRHRVL